MQLFQPAFELVSGDSMWVDTLTVYEQRTHAFVMRPLVRGTRISCSVVSARIDSALTIGGNDCVAMTVR